MMVGPLPRYKVVRTDDVESRQDNGPGRQTFVADVVGSRTFDTSVKLNMEIDSRIRFIRHLKGDEKSDEYAG